MSYRFEISLEEWNGSYPRRLAPFIALSLALHLILFGAFIGTEKFFARGKGIEVQIFKPGENVAPLPTIWNPLISQHRQKVFRVDFFRQIVPWHVSEAQAAVIPSTVETEPEVTLAERPEPEPEKPEPIEKPQPSEEIKPVETETIVESRETSVPMTESPSEAVTGSMGEPSEPLSLTPPPEAVIPETPVVGSTDVVEAPEVRRVEREGYFPPAFPRRYINLPPPPVVQPVLPQGVRREDRLPDAFGVFPPQDSEGNIGEAILLPPWSLVDIGGNRWQGSDFLGNYTIYLVGDISRRHGLEELLAWNWVLKRLITNEYAAYPPYMATIGTALENPYGYNELRMRVMLQHAQEEEHTFGLTLLDPEGAFAHSLGYAELPQPIVLFVDQAGFLRMLLIGRVRDIRDENISVAMDIIADMWQWTDLERATLPQTVAILINYLRQKAYDPIARREPPSETAFAIAPNWGIPIPQVSNEGSLSNNSIQ